MVHGGRWNPKESFPVLYVALEEETAVSEMRRAAERQGMHPSELLPRTITELDITLSRVLDLATDDGPEAIGVSAGDLTSDDASTCQAVGAAAHYLGFEAIRARSAAGEGEILAVFWDKLLPGSSVNPTGSFELSSLDPPGESGTP